MGDKMTKCPGSMARGKRSGEHKWEYREMVKGDPGSRAKTCSYCYKFYTDCVLGRKQNSHNSMRGGCPVITRGEGGGIDSRHKWKKYPGGSFGPVGSNGKTLYFKRGGMHCSKCGISQYQARKRGKV